MNHCLLEATIKTAPTIRYTQDNQTAIAEMEVLFDGLRTDDPQGSIKVIGWGNMAQDLQNRIEIGQKVILEGRLRMNTVPRPDGTKEKKAEFTLSKIHSSSDNSNELNTKSNNPTASPEPSTTNNADITNKAENQVAWDSSPLIPDTDDIPF